ncbi:unnamed protein product [Prorocentrum cordatum]|uniref:Uncharacterized protein n=1 Tax=Prorocentrum cordatum TaxID=2364126 RepID=A0ABN9WA67_9DINO|nr:unnamed protein product [Polarella glacialis]
MHFDAVLSPCVMNRTFEVNKLGVFNFKKLYMTSVEFFEGCNCYNETEGKCKPKKKCHWHHWHNYHKVEWSTALAQVHEAFPATTFDFNDTDIWKMDDDNFLHSSPCISTLPVTVRHIRRTEESAPRNCRVTHLEAFGANFQRGYSGHGLRRRLLQYFDTLFLEAAHIQLRPQDGSHRELEP